VTDSPPSPRRLWAKKKPRILFLRQSLLRWKREREAGRKGGATLIQKKVRRLSALPRNPERILLIARERIVAEGKKTLRREEKGKKQGAHLREIGETPDRGKDRDLEGTSTASHLHDD